MSKNDLQVQHDVETELHHDLAINAAHIDVRVDGRAVLLTGAVRTYAEKWAAEEAAKRMAGDRAIAHEVTVEPAGPGEQTDANIAQAVQRAFAWNLWIPESVTFAVRDGGVSLAGEVEWSYQRDAAEKAVRRLPGIARVDNAITLKPSFAATMA